MHAILRPRLGNGLLDQLTAPVFLAVGLDSMIIVMPLAAEPGRHSSAAKTQSVGHEASPDVG